MRELIEFEEAAARLAEKEQRIEHARQNRTNELGCRIGRIAEERCKVNDKLG